MNENEEKTHACCEEKDEKYTERSEEERTKLIHRLNRIEGQVRGLKKMVDNDAYCADLLMQSAAISAALRSFNKLLLNRHIHTCVVRDIKDGKDEVVDELVYLLGKLMI